MIETEWLITTQPAKMLGWLGAELRNQTVTDWGRKINHRRARLFACACCRWSWDKLTDQRLRDSVETAEIFADDGTTKEQLEFVHKVASQALSETMGRSPSEYARAWTAMMASLPNARIAFFLTGLVGMQDGYDRPLPRAVQVDLLREVFGNPFRPVITDCYPAEDGTCVTHSCAFQKTGDATAMCPGGRGWFRTRIACDPAVRDLAFAAYMERSNQGPAQLDHSRLLVLADALEEAGMQPVKGRTVSQVIQERQLAVMGGCCDRFADHMGCDCLELAQPDGVLEHLRSPGPHVRGCWALDFILGKE